MHWSEGNIGLELSAILAYSMAIPYWDKDMHAAKLNLNHMSHSPCHVQLAFHCLLYVLPVDKSWTGAWEQVYSFNSQCESESCFPMITAKKQSLSNFFLLWGHAFHVHCDSYMEGEVHHIFTPELYIKTTLYVHTVTSHCVRCTNSDITLCSL